MKQEVGLPHLGSLQAQVRPAQPYLPCCHEGQGFQIKTVLWTTFIASDIHCCSINSQTQKMCSGSQNLWFGAFSIY